jgi:hypothetical protein
VIVGLRIKILAVRFCKLFSGFSKTRKADAFVIIPIKHTTIGTNASGIYFSLKFLEFLN